MSLSNGFRATEKAENPHRQTSGLVNPNQIVPVELARGRAALAPSAIDAHTSLIRYKDRRTPTQMNLATTGYLVTAFAPSRGESDSEAVAEGQGGLSFADPTQASITSQTPNRVITLDYKLALDA
ncbi:hypothetical protein B0H16DRAFT_1453238 [Mycena metata]|uniref:Uncharacterized protein n=1 Tax=Mycena metata TaxID=1033252 RepID=A0AAD7NN26_9AGAR|nr:hypothetical protein B0H16DRAFT_1453238 [Mycena metata]